MKGIQAIWKDGHIIPTQPVDWPDGTTLSIEAIEQPEESERGADLLGDSPSSIASWITAFDALPPLLMLDAEEEEWREARRDMKEHTIGKMRDLSIEDRS